MEDNPQPVAAARPDALARRGAIGGFFVDLAIAVVVLLAMSVLTGIAWAMIRAVQVAVQGVDAQDMQALTAAIGRPGGLAMLWMTLFNTAVAAAVPYFWRRRASAAERAMSFAAIRKPGTWGWIGLTTAAVFAFSNGLTALGRTAGFAPEPTNIAPIEQAMASSPLFVTLFVVLLAPAYEELLFRRVLFGRLWAAGRPWLGLVLSSACFAFMHEMPGLTANSAPATLLLWTTYGLMGAAFAWLYRRTGTLWAPIAAHALNNAVALLALQLSTAPV